MNRIKLLVDNSIFYRISSILIYIFFLSRLIILPEGKLSIIPNPIVLSFTLVTTLIFTFFAQDLKHHEFSKMQFLSRHLLAIIPPLLGARIVYNTIKQEKSKQNDPVYIWGLFILLGILGIFSIFLLILVFLVLVLTGNLQILYLLGWTTLGITGITVADWVSQIREYQSSSESSIRDEFLERIILPLTKSSKHRLRTSLAIYIVFITLIFVTTISDFLPITI